MNCYNFQRKFEYPIKRGFKRSTIRARRKNGYVPTVGEKIKLYCGQRTKNCRLLGVVTVKSVLPIAIYQDDDSQQRDVIVDGKKFFHSDEIQNLVSMEGFASTAEFFEFFRYAYGRSFLGYWIGWGQS